MNAGVQVLVGAFSCISIALAFAADVTPPRHRGAVFGFIMGSFSFGVVVGAADCPALTKVLPSLLRWRLCNYMLYS